MNERQDRVSITHPRTNAAERQERSPLETDARRLRRGRGSGGPDHDDGISLSDLAIAAIVRAQLLLAVRYFVTLVGSLVIIPLLVTAPGIRTIALWGVPISWIAFGTLFFPLFLVLGHAYRRAAERLEDRFVTVIEPR
jgi:hypothetical protein